MESVSKAFNYKVVIYMRSVFFQPTNSFTHLLFPFSDHTDDVFPFCGQGVCEHVLFFSQTKTKCAHQNQHPYTKKLKHTHKYIRKCFCFTLGLHIQHVSDLLFFSFFHRRWESLNLSPTNFLWIWLSTPFTILGIKY